MTNLYYSNREVIDQLISAFNDLLKASDEVRLSALQEIEDYPVFAPTYGDSEMDHRSNQARLAVMNSMMRIYKPTKSETYLPSGILCASNQLINKVITLNKFKEIFSKTVSKTQRLSGISLRESNGEFISNLIKNEILHRTNNQPFDLKTSEQIIYNKLDLKACRTKIRIMPKHMDMLSWTWASNHKRVVKISKSEALDLAYRLPDSQSISACKSIESCSDQHFAKITPLKEQLRANYVYYEDGKRVQKSTPISGVVVVQQNTLPRLLWRDPPSLRIYQEPRLPRVSTIHNEPFVAEISLYKYR